MTIANSSTILADANVVSVGISDTAANTGSDIDTLQTLAAASELASVTLTDGGTPTVTITAPQATNDATAIGKITGTYHLTVSDSSTNVLANLAGLESLGSKLTTVVLTDGGTPNLAITAAQYTSDITAINKITSAYTMTVSAVTAANASTVGGNTHDTSFTVSDTAAHVTTSIAALQTQATGGKLSSITLTDSGTPVLLVTGAQLNTDASAISKITTAYDETDANTTETLAGTGTLNTISFTSEAQGVTANLSTGTATTVHSGTTNTYSLSGFANITGSTHADTLTAGSSGALMIGDGGADTYNLNASGIDVAQDTATHLNGTTVNNFTVLDGIDLTNIAFGGGTTLGFSEDASNTFGTLTVSDGTHTAALTLLGNYTAASFQDVSDGASGTMVAMASTTHLTAILAAAQA